MTVTFFLLGGSEVRDLGRGQRGEEVLIRHGQELRGLVRKVVAVPRLALGVLAVTVTVMIKVVIVVMIAVMITVMIAVMIAVTVTVS